ncbi:MAG: hypothetical protein QXN93_03265 [Methanomassiliicoccales archaeon]
MQTHSHCRFVTAEDSGRIDSGESAAEPHLASSGEGWIGCGGEAGGIEYLRLGRRSAQA